MSFAESYMTPGNANNNDFTGDMQSVAASRSVHSHHSIGGLSVKSDRNEKGKTGNHAFPFGKQQGLLTAPAALLGSPTSLASPGGGRFKFSPEKLSITETLRYLFFFFGKTKNYYNNITFCFIFE
jgi:hypothetical protein